MPPRSWSVDFRLMQAAEMLERDPITAARIAGELLVRAPERADIALLLGSARHALGNAASAANIFANLALAHPGSAVIQLEYARALATQGDAEAARGRLEQAVSLQPKLADAWRELSLLYAHAGNPDRCDTAYAHYSALVRCGQQVNEASQLLGNGRIEAARALLERYLKAHPQDPFGLRLATEIAVVTEDYAEAERLLHEALRIAPGDSAARLALVRVYGTQQKPEAMQPLLERLLRLEPGNLDYLLLKATAFNLLGLNAESLQIIEQLLLDHPQNERVWLQYGHALRAGGSIAKSIEAYRRSTQLAPQLGEAWFSLSNLKTFRFAPEEITGILTQLRHSELKAETRLLFEFTLGKALEDAGSYAEAFEHYAQGNAIRRALIRYDAREITRFVERNEQLFTPEFFAARAAWGASAADPIFIVGLPRSGSTLLEQILASHSEVEGTRELPYMLGIAREFGALQLPDAEPVYPHSLAALTREQAQAFGARYLQEAASHRLLGRRHFIDKMPSNWMHIGLIQLLLPNARIIDARRGPLASGVANFKQHFQQGMWFSYDLADIGGFYRDYVRLMSHFDQVLPGRVHRVHYERLVSDFESEVRALLEFCGLPFEAQCLRFHETRRVVQTVSSEQVRMPLYTEALAQWRNFDPWLTPLKSALGELGKSDG